MDLDNDGVLDLYSGSYSCDSSKGLAPVQFFKGKKHDPFNFEKPVPIKTLSGALPDLKDFKKLKRDTSKYNVYQSIDPGMTKPHFVDINGDGNLDLIYGEQNGNLVQFLGTDTKGVNNLSDTGEVLRDVDGNLLKPGDISSPHFTDWDGDQDLDIISGTGEGGIYYSENIGDVNTPKWKAFTEWLPPITGDDGPRPEHQNSRHKLQPSTNTTVQVVDYNNDGKLDLLVGDHARLNTPVEGISDEDYLKKEAEYQEMRMLNGPTLDANREYYRLKRAKDPKESKEVIAAALTKYRELISINRDKANAFRDSFKTSERTGFVWLYLQK